LLHAGPAFDAILRMGRAGLIVFDLVDLAWTDLSAVFTSVARLLLDHRVHNYSISNCKFQIADCRLKISVI
jgi:hypothetical protein